MTRPVDCDPCIKAIETFQTQSPKIVLIECYKVGDIFADAGLNPKTYYIRALSNSSTDDFMATMGTCYLDGKLRD